MKVRKNTVIDALQKFWPGVRTVVDAQRRLLIHVEGADQDTGEMGKPGECALARACQREHDIDAVLIFKSTAYLRQGTHVTRFCVPESVTREIVSFDRAGICRRPRSRKNSGCRRRHRGSGTGARSASRRCTCAPTGFGRA